MDKEELRQKLLIAKEQYINKNLLRIEEIRPKWESTQSNIPIIENIKPYIEFCSTQDLQDLWWYGRSTVSSAPLCYDDKTDILTEYGWKRFKDLLKSDKVATLNTDTNELEYQLPVDYVNQHYSGEMFRQSGSVDLLVTPNHNLYISRDKHFDFKLVKAEYSNRYVRYTSKFNWSGKDVSDIVLPAAEHINKGCRYEDITINTETFVKLLGFYLAEGHYTKYGICITQNVGDKLDEFLSVLDNGKIRYTIQEKTNVSRRIVISGKTWANYFKQFGKCDSRFIPTNIKNLPVKYLVSLLHFMMLGDGTTRNRADGSTEHSYLTISKRLADDANEICLKIGYNSKVRTYTNICGNKAYIVSFNPTYKTYNPNSHKDLRSKEYYSGAVYSVTVPNHIIMVRRNGKPVWSGNSGEVGRRIHYLIRDKDTGFILGIVGLASDLTIPIRDKYIGWTHQNKWAGKRINYLMNIQHCFHPDNSILTTNGIKYVKDLEPNDAIYSVDKSGSIVEKPILWVNKKTTNESMLKISTRQGGLVLVTSGHHMIGVKNGSHLDRKKRKEWEDLSAEELEVGDIIPIPYQSNLLSSLCSNFKDYFDYDYTDVTRRVRESYKIHVKMSDMIKFAGWYLSEGCVTNNYVDLGQSPSSKYYSELVSFVKELCSQLGCNYYTNANHINISNAKFARFVRDTFGARENKVIPDFVLRDNIRLFFDSYIKGDGHIEDRMTGKKIVITTVAPKLSKQLTEIAIRLNYAVSISYKVGTTYEQKNRGYKTSGKVIRKPQYILYIKSTKVKKYNDVYYDRIVKIEKIKSPEYVVDFEVKDTHTALVGYNHNFVFCGQCVATSELSKYLTGKLCALSARSSEVQSHFENKYKHSLAAMTVTSLYGKSSVYNRLDGFEYLGTTKGYSSVLIPLEIKQKMREDYKREKGKHSEIYYNEDGSVKNKFGVVKGFQKLSKYAKVQSVENFRGVYVVPLAYNYKEFLKQETDCLQSYNHLTFDELIKHWRDRWLLGRLERMSQSALSEA
jgi:hypothetical protein